MKLGSLGVCVSVFTLCGISQSALGAAEAAAALFVRGDCNSDGQVDPSDAIYTFSVLFRGRATPRCADACDSNDSRGFDISDGIYLLSYLFMGGPSPLPPFPLPGPDGEGDDGLGCEATGPATDSFHPLDDQPIGQWLSTKPNYSLESDGSLFALETVGGSKVYATRTGLDGIHSHYVGFDDRGWAFYRFAGRIRREDASAGVGVTFLSHYPEEDAYYRLQAVGDKRFHIEARGTTITGGDAFTGVEAKPGGWYQFVVEVYPGASSTRILAKVWTEGFGEPDMWQIDCSDSSPTRLRYGTIGCWSEGVGAKFWSALNVEIDSESVEPPDDEPEPEPEPVGSVRIELDHSFLQPGDTAQLTVFSTDSGAQNVTNAITYAVSDPSVLSVASRTDSLEVQAIGKGYAEITVTHPILGSDSVLVGVYDPEDFAESEFQNSVSQYGITWRFGEARPTGRFINGDWWVVGPVDVVEVTPGWDGKHNGSMINPRYGNHHGYDARFNFDASLRAKFPAVVNPGKSIVSVISWQTGEKGAPDIVEGSSIPIPRPALKTAAVLTVLDSQPPRNAFRPSYAGDEKRIFVADQLRLERLLDLRKPSFVPDIVELEQDTTRPWLDHQSTWTSAYLNPSANMPNYGREIASVYNSACLMLMLDLDREDRERLLLRLVQIGIDFYGVHLTGADWGYAGGGLGSGRKWPVLFAGIMLDDARMQNFGAEFGPKTVQEDCQTFYLTQADTKNYPGVAIGTPVWGAVHCSTLSYHKDPGNTGYQWCCTANGWVGAALCAHLLNAVDLWNHPAFFDYMDWYMSFIPKGSWKRSWSTFTELMWDLYR